MYSELDFSKDRVETKSLFFCRGAELIEDLRIKDVKKEAERESQILQKIKMKMDRIKATQQKILEPVHDPTTHAKGNFVGGRCA